MWWHRMLTPFLVEGSTSPQEINQSMVGVLTRLLTEIKPGTTATTHLDVNLVSWPPNLVELPDQGAGRRAWSDCWRSSAGPGPATAAIPACSASSRWLC